MVDAGTHHFVKSSAKSDRVLGLRPLDDLRTPWLCSNNRPLYLRTPIYRNPRSDMSAELEQILKIFRLISWLARILVARCCDAGFQLLPGPIWFPRSMHPEGLRMMESETTSGPLSDRKIVDTTVERAESEKVATLLGLT